MFTNLFPINIVKALPRNLCGEISENSDSMKLPVPDVNIINICSAVIALFLYPTNTS